jgi:hypothetical protein
MGTGFADDACTIALDYVTESPCCEYELVMIGKWSQPTSCGSVQLDTIHAVETHDEDIVHVLGPQGDCVEEPAQENSTYFLAGDELDPVEALAEITLLD